MGKRFMPDNNLGYPVLIRVGTSTGSGFYFRTDAGVFLVSALHVFFYREKSKIQIKGGVAHLSSYGPNPETNKRIVLAIDLTKTPVRTNKLRDVVVIEIGKVTGTGKWSYGNGVVALASGAPQEGIVVVPRSSLKLFNDVLISNEVFVMGYPSSLGVGTNQIEPHRPLLRKGIVAGKNHERKTIILDCPVYFGNSGGLVIEVSEKNVGHREFIVIGIISQFIPFVEELTSKQLGYTNRNYENSGYSIAVPVDTIIRLTRTTPRRELQKKNT